MSSPNRQARKSVRLVSVELGFTLVIQFISGIALARILDPTDFGLYGITLSVFSLAALFSDLGTRERLIQTQDEPDVRMLKIALTSRLLLCGVVVPLVWIFSTSIARVYTEEPSQLSWMIRVYSVALLVGAVRLNCEISLERKLVYQPLAIVGMLEVFARRALILVLALSGAGAWSFIWGHTLGGLAATVALWRLTRAPLGFAFDRHLTVDLMRQGLNFRLHSVGGRLRRLIMVTLVTRTLGLEATGYLKWAQDTGARSLLLVAGATRVALSHFSRLRESPSVVQSVLQRYIYVSVLLLGLWFCVLSTAGKDLILWIYTEKWLPAWEATCVFALGVLLLAVVRFAVAALQGGGRPRYAMLLTFAQAALTLAFVVFLVPALGIPGAALGELLTFALTIPFLVWAIPGIEPGRILRPLARLLVPLGLALASGYLVAGTVTLLVPRALLATATTTAIYLLAGWVTGPAWLRLFVRQEISLVKETLTRFASQRR